MTIAPSTQWIQFKNSLFDTIKQITNTNIEDLVRAQQLGETFSFAAGRSLFEKAISLFQALSSTDLSLASDAKLRRLNELSSEVLQHFQKFRNFSPQGPGNMIQNRDNLLTSFFPVYDQAFDTIAGVLSVSQRQNLGQYESEAKATTERIETFFNQEREKFEGYKGAAEQDISDTISKAKQAAQEVGITQHSAFFRSEANEHETMAARWLVATVVLAAIAGWVGWLNYSHTLSILQITSASKSLPGTTADVSLTIQLAIAKLIVFSILFSAVLWAGRIYRAHRHNYVINKHRQNALSTFEAFAKATEDAQTKNAVLLQATQCIFGPQATGYLSQEKESEGSTQIFEFIRNAASGKS